VGIVSRQAIKGSIYIYIGVFIGFVTSGILMPKLLDSESIGLIKLITSYSMLFGQLASLGFVPATTKIFPHFRNKENGHNGFLVISMFVGILGFIVMLVSFYLLKDLILAKTQTTSINFDDYIFYVLIISVFTSFFLIIDAYARALYYTSTGIFFKDFVQKVLNLIIVAIYGLGIYNFNSFIVLFALINCLPTLLIVIFLIYKKEFSIKINLSFVSKDLKKELIHVSLFGIIASFSGILVINIDSIMISTLIGMNAAGVYATIFYFAFVITIPYRSMERITASVISEFWNKNNMSGIFEIYKKSCINQAVVALFLFVMIWGNEHNIFRFLPPEFSAGRYVILFLGIGNFINMASGVNNSIIGTSNFYRFQTYVQIILIILLILTNYIFIPIWGITGAAIASFLSMFILNFLKYIFILYKFKMQPFDIKIIYVILLGIGLIIINYLLPILKNLYIDGVYRISILGILFIYISYKINLSNDLNSIIEKYLKKFKLIL